MYRCLFSTKWRRTNPRVSLLHNSRGTRARPGRLPRELRGYPRLTLNRCSQPSQGGSSCGNPRNWGPYYAKDCDFLRRCREAMFLIVSNSLIVWTQYDFSIPNELASHARPDDSSCCFGGEVAPVRVSTLRSVPAALAVFFLIAVRFGVRAPVSSWLPAWADNPPVLAPRNVHATHR